MIKNFLSGFLSVVAVTCLGACQDYDEIINGTSTEKSILTRAASEDYTEGLAAPYSDAIYPMDYVPKEETAQEISDRDSRLRLHIADYWQKLNGYLSSNNVSGWINSQSSSYTDLTYLCLDYNYPELKSVLIPKIKESMNANYLTLLKEIETDKKNGYDGSLRDLNTVQPAEAILQNAYNLKRLGAYSGTVKGFVENFINTYVTTNTHYYQGKYLSTGYNKELYAMDVAFWVKMLYADDASKYKLCKTSFDNVYNALLNNSYDADNSPHYDANTGFNLLLHWGLLQGKEDDLRNSIHVRRIIDRMSKTVMSNGENAGWGKLMWKWKTKNSEYLIDAAEGLTWCLKVGYRLFKDPFYLYVARKYEDFRINVGCSSWNSNHVDLYPIDINRNDINLSVLVNQPASYITHRITKEGSTNLGRGDADYIEVQDKLILSTGHHPRSPYMLMDLAYTQSKSAPDHRIGVDNLIFNGAHICTYLGRPSEGFRINRPYVAPKSLSSDFPIFNIAEKEVALSDAADSINGYSPKTDYVLGSYSVTPMYADVAYGEVNYTKFEYDGVSAKRKMFLLNNGILVVYDKITSASDKNRTDVVGVLYNVWPSVEKTGTNWLLQGTHQCSLAEKNSQYDTEVKTLYYFPRTKNTCTMSVKSDPLRDNASISQVLCNQTDLNSGEDAEFISLIVPIRKSADLDSFVNGIAITKKGTTYTLSIPSPSGKPIIVTVGDGVQDVSYQ